MISNKFRGAAGTAAFSEGLAFSATRPAAQERARAAAYDAVEKVLNSMSQPIGPQAFATRWNDAVDAMTKHLENEMQGRSSLP